MIVLYGTSESRAQRSLWMLKELGTPFEHVPTHFLDGGTSAPAFMAVNPNGKVPALVDDNVTLFESMAINLYLANKFGGSLAPANDIEEAYALQWSFWGVNEIEKSLMFAGFNLLLFPPEDRSEAELVRMTQKLDRPLKVLDAALADRPYLLGDRFTVADVNLAGVLSLAFVAKYPLDPYPNVKLWLHQCLGRPAAADLTSTTLSLPRPPADDLLSMLL